jgi:ubiquinone/menaquinone biosynthesis C-methylase UbiE
MYKVLDNPLVYKAAQLILAPGAETLTLNNIRKLYAHLPPGGELLDVGCGPASWLFKLGLEPVGADINPTYMLKYSTNGAHGVVASADKLPFASHSFDGVWTIGMLHHLPDSAASQTVSEFLRVCKPGGYVVVVDAVMPQVTWKRPIAYVVRRMDRGRFVRRQAELEKLLPDRKKWLVRRWEYTYTGMEVLLCWLRKVES